MFIASQQYEGTGQCSFEIVDQDTPLPAANAVH